MHEIYGTNFDYIFHKKLHYQTPQSVVFGFTDVLDHNCHFVNYLKCVISQLKYIEEIISEDDLNKKRKILNKWKLIYHLFLS